MGRHYLPRSDRHPRRLRRLRRSWPAVGITGVNAPNASDPVKVNALQWGCQFHSDAPPVGQTYTMTIKRQTIATGAAKADLVITFSGAANDTALQLAVKAAAALDANAAITSPVPSTRAFTFGLADALDEITFAIITGAPTAAIMPVTFEQSDESESEPVAETVQVATTKKTTRR